MNRLHHYHVTTRWTGNRGSGTLDYRAYSRDHVIGIADKAQTIQASSDPLFRGDGTRLNPEELFLASLSSCHMLWYLHLASVHEVVVLEYEDFAEGTIRESGEGGRPLYLGRPKAPHPIGGDAGATRPGPARRGR